MRWAPKVATMIIAASASILHLGTLTTAALWSRWKGEEQVQDEKRLPDVVFERRSTRMRQVAGRLIRGAKDLRSRRRRNSKRTLEHHLHNPHMESANANSGDYTALINAKSSDLVQRKRRGRGEDAPVNVLILMSDTGGGHRASAEALEAAFDILYPGQVSVKMVDILTEHSAWPVNESVAAYQYAAKNPIVWRAMYEVARFPPTRWFNDKLMAFQNFHRFTDAIRSYDPDLVVSVHPLCQNLPLKVLKAMGTSGSRELPFVTVITDLGGAHPTWFDREADKVFLASEAVMRVAFRVGVDSRRIYHLGLPTRPAFWEDPRPKSELRYELGLELEPKAVIVIGGGDGVGGMGAVAVAVIKALSKLPSRTQVVVICGKNAVVKKELEERQWPSSVFLKVLGFVGNMDEWMGAVDVIVTKAGPGTIAEATIRGLPIMLSGYLPGQEEGNVPYVVDGGFGSFSRVPDVIGDTVAAWLGNEPLLHKMSEAAKRAAKPSATFDIAKEIGGMMFDGTNVLAEGERKEHPYDSIQSE